MRKIINYTAWILVVAGGVNWGLIGLFDFDLVKFVFGHWNWLVRLVHVLVAISTIYAALGTCKCVNKEEIA